MPRTALTELFEGPDSNTQLVEYLKKLGIILVPKEGEVRLASLEEVKKRAIAFNNWVRNHFWELFPELIPRPAEESKTDDDYGYTRPVLTFKPEAEAPQFMDLTETSLTEPEELFCVFMDSFRMMTNSLNVAKLDAEIRFRTALARSLERDFGIHLNTLPLGCVDAGGLAPGQLPRQEINMRFLCGQMSNEEFYTYYHKNFAPSQPFQFAAADDPQITRVYLHTMQMRPEFRARSLNAHELLVTLHLLRQAASFVRINRGNFEDEMLYGMANDCLERILAVRVLEARAEGMRAVLLNKLADGRTHLKAPEIRRLERQILNLETRYLGGELLRSMHERGCVDMGISDFLNLNGQAKEQKNRRGPTPFAMRPDIFNR